MTWVLLVRRIATGQSYVTCHFVVRKINDSIRRLVKYKCKLLNIPKQLLVSVSSVYSSYCIHLLLTVCTANSRLYKTA